MSLELEAMLESHYDKNWRRKLERLQPSSAFISSPITCSSCAVYLASLPSCCFLLTDDLFGTKLPCLFVLAASFLSTISGKLDWAWAFGHPWGGGVYLVTLSFSFKKSITYKKTLMYIHFYDCLLVRTSLSSIRNSRTWSVRGKSGLLAVAYIRVSSQESTVVS